MLTIHAVSHTHWDREWYHTAERFRQRLIPLVDELIDDPPAPGSSFLLDGQTVVLEDYLDVRPERASELASALRARRLEAGPWFVLPDELIPTGEGLVRNLLAGARTLRSLRAESPPVLYCPDSFGHPARLPDIARGFDKSIVIAWRGFGGSRAPQSDVAWWTSPGGERVLLYHLTRSGYELGSSLPSDDSAPERWSRIRAEFGTRAVTGVALLLNGADHHARQTNVSAAIEALKIAASPEIVKPSRLTDFATELTRRAAARGSAIPEIAGELRDSYGFTWTLQGTLATRTPQKRRYALAERSLVRDVEPWAAIASLNGRTARRPLVQAVWRTLLLCQPHDTLCGCSIDQVARAMDARLESTEAQISGLREEAVLDIIAHDRDAARGQPKQWKPIVLVRNRSARTRSGVARITITEKVADIAVGPGSAGKTMSKSATYERTEAPRAYPDNDLVESTTRHVWIESVPPLGIISIPLNDAKRSKAAPEISVRVRGRSITNGQLTISWNARGDITLEQPGDKRRVPSFLEWESRRDEGDLYTPSIRGRKFAPRLLSAKVIEKSALHAALEQRWLFKGKDEWVSVALRVSLEANAPFARIAIAGDNRASDHRLRLHVRSDVGAGMTIADAAFGPLQRDQITVPTAAMKMERPVATAPLHRYVSRFDQKCGATLYSDGLAEYESTKSGFAITLLRSVGQLSRRDLPERPGHAGWPAATPEAQCVGAFAAELAIMLHGPRTNATIDEIESVSDDVLFPLEGTTLRSALRVPAPIMGLALEGAGLAFSCAKESETGDAIVLRCVNLLDQEVAGSWRLPRMVRDPQLARLDETPLTPIEVRGDRIPFLAPPRGIVTILVR
jgi:alpha-mannosidase